MGGYGIIAVYGGAQPGRTVLLRCEIDAVPVEETLEIPYRSVRRNISHKCGHDGHMAIMAGVAAWLKPNHHRTGAVLLLFQPAEETGSGALKVLSDPLYSQFKPDLAIALHNLPGFPMGEIIMGDGTFASASTGMIVKLTGRSSHAGEPLAGVSPAGAVASMIDHFERISCPAEGIFITLVHATIGEAGFGILPSEATVMATLRAPAMEQVKELSDRSVREFARIAEEEGLAFEIEWTEEFPSTENSDSANRLIRGAAKQLHMPVREIKGPFPWSEDFGHFTMNYPGALFGIGSGEGSPPLHSPEYDFPDSLIRPGIDILTGIIERAFDQ